MPDHIIFEDRTFKHLNVGRVTGLAPGMTRGELSKGHKKHIYTTRWNVLTTK